MSPLHLVTNEKDPLARCLFDIEKRHATALGRFPEPDESPPPVLYSIARQGLWLVAETFPVPDAMWQIFNTPGALLHALAIAAGEIPAIVAAAGPNFHGLAFCMESWMLDDPEGLSPEDQQAADNRQLHRHPHRQHVRIVLACTTNNQLAAVLHIKDNEPMLWTHGDLGGEMAEGLHELVQAIQRAVTTVRNN